jgi:cytochrome c556
MRDPRPSLPLFLALASLLGLASCGGGSATTQPQGMEDMQNMNMDQMMAHCRQVQGMDRSQMSRDMQRMMQQCDAMMRSHGSGSNSGSSAPSNP